MTTKNNIKFFIFLIFLVSACSKPNHTHDNSESTAKKRMYYLVPEQTAIKMEKEKGLVLSGTGGSRKLFLSFNYNGPAGIPKARELIFYAIETSIKAMNENEKLRFELNKFPCSYDQLEIILFIEKSDRNSVESVIFTKGKIQYFSNYTLLLEEEYPKTC